MASNQVPDKTDNARNRFAAFFVPVLAALAMVFILVATWVGIGYVDKQIKAEIADRLTRTHKTTRDFVHSWHEAREKEALIWAEEPAVISATRSLLVAQIKGRALVGHFALKNLRQIFEPVIREKGYLGFYIIDKRTRVIASVNDAGLNQTNHLFSENQRISDVFKTKEPAFIGTVNPRTIRHVEEKDMEIGEDRTMFASAPIFGEEGDVDAVLIFHIDPARGFTTIFNHGQIGETGESYAYDTFGRLISDSRFDDQLKKIGLLGKDETSIFNITIADPGVDLTEGHKPLLPRSQWPLTFMVKQAMAGRAGIDLVGYRDYRGVPVLGTWSWEGDLGIGITTEMDKAEAYEVLNVVRLLMGLGAGISIVLLGAVSFFSFIGRRRVEDERARITAIVEHAIDGIIMISDSGTMETANPAASHIFGYEHGEMIGQNIKMLTPEPHRSAHDSYLQKYLKTGVAGIIGIGREVEGQHKDGSTLGIDLGITEVFYRGERKFIGTVRDITERIAAEQELTRFKTTLDQIEDYVFMFDPETLKFFYVNRGGADHIGYSETELLSKTPSDIAPAFDFDEFKEIIGPLMKGESKSLVFETFHQHMDGSLIPIEMSLQYIAPHEEAPRFVAIVRDITERLKSDEELKRTASGLANAQRIAHLGSWEWDIVSGDLHWSDEIYRIFGLEPRQFGATYEAFIQAVHPDDREAVQGAVQTSLEEKHPYHIIHRVVQPGGAVRTVEEQGEAEYDNRGNPTRMNGIVQDVTERVAAESVKREFISTVSHELRTPLTAIHGSHGLLLGGAGGDLGDQAKKLLTIAHENSDRLIRLINDILDIEKLEAGKMNFSMGDYDAIELIKKSLAANESYGDKFGVSLVFESALKTADVYVDSDRISQVMSNLLSNAAKFSPKGGKIEIALSDAADSYLVKVTDHGPGIPEEFQKKIFSRFAQADSSDTRQKGGTGLGLSITRAIVEHLGGEVGFETEIGSGTTFYFTLPKKTETQSEVSSLEAESSGLPKILICEDNKDIAMILGEILKKNGFASDIAYTAKEAKDLLLSNTYIAMTLDIILPDENGFSVIHWVREKTDLADLPIIIISGVPDEEKKNLNGGAVQVVDWLAKPLEASRLERVLLQLRFSKAGKIGRVLHVEDDEAVAEIVRTAMEGIAEISVAPTLREAKKLIALDNFDLILLDVELPDGSGLDLLSDSKGRNARPVPVVIFSAGDFDSDTAKNVAAILTKSRNSIDDLVSAVSNILKEQGLGEIDS